MSKSAAWTRLDRPGCDAALLRPHRDGWLLQGAAAFDHDGGSATVAYQVETDARRETRRGLVCGFLGDKTVRHEILRDTSGLAPERRLGRRPGASGRPGLRVHARDQRAATCAHRAAAGQRAEVSVAWFDVDSATLIELPQTYERRGETSYWYEAPTVPYQALLEIAPNGFVQSYPGLWRLVA